MHNSEELKKIIYISSFDISGVKNPVLTISGRFLKQDSSLAFYLDGVKIKPDYEYVGKSLQFDYRVNFNVKNKLIEIYYIEGKQKIKVYSKNTSLFKRGIKKFNGIVSFQFGKLTGKYKTSEYYHVSNKSEYNRWLKEQDVEEYHDTFSYRPLISIVTPVYNVKASYLEECVQSVMNQIYDNWELLLIDDCSTKKETIDKLKEMEDKDARIRVIYRKENGNISKASNDGIKAAKGVFIALLDNDDVITKDALYQMVKALNENKNYDFIYSDEDKWDLREIPCQPHFKNDFSPDLLLSQNYICHFTMIRKKLITEVGGFEVGLEGAQDYDLFLKVTEKTNHIYHISKILYHWRMSETSTAMNLKSKNYALEKEKKALENALKRRKIDAEVLIDHDSKYFIVHYLYTKEPKISIIIPTKDYADTLDTCLKSIYEKSTYHNYEIIVVNNNSCEDKTFQLFDKYKKEHSNFKVIDANIPFNYSKLNNIAVKESTGEYLMLLNNDTEVITPDWLDIMVGYAMQDHIGAVGPKLMYFDNTVQHAGVILGLGGVAGHAYVGASAKNIGLYGRLRVPFDYGAVTAACLMVSKKKYLEVNGFEEELSVAFNDIDFNVKLLQKGYYNVELPQVILYHYESKSRGMDTTPEHAKRFNKECLYMQKKWGDTLKNDPFYNRNYSLKHFFVLDKKNNK